MTLAEELRARLSGTVALVGVGNPQCGDDAAGCLLARRLQGALGVHAVEAEEVPEDFVGDVARFAPTTVVFADAVELSRPPGDVALLEIEDVAPYAPTTHRAPLSLVMDVVRRRTGADVFLLAVQPGRRGFGVAPSAEVAETDERLAALILEAVHATRDRVDARPFLREEAAG